MAELLVLPDEVSVVNVGLPMFADAVRDQGRPVQHVDWRIPAGGDLAAVRALEHLYGDAAAAIDAANAEAVRRLDEGVPQLVGIGTIGADVPGVEGRMLLHCGPPLPYAEHCDPLQRSMRAAVVAEGWAADVAGAAGTARPRRDRARRRQPPRHRRPDGVRRRAVAARVRRGEPRGRHPGVLPAQPGSRRRRLVRPRHRRGRSPGCASSRDSGGPAVAAILERTGPLDVLAIAAQGITMGDDLHMRTQAATNLLTRTWLPHIAALPDAVREGVRRLPRRQPPVLPEPGDGGGQVAAAVGRAGTGVQHRHDDVAQRHHVRRQARRARPTWHITDSPPVGDALYNAGQGPETAAPDIGDSAVLELTGMGGPAAGNSPAVASFLGGTMADAAAATEGFRAICAGSSRRFTLPAMGFSGTPLGVDVRKVVELGITPKVTTGILHASDGSGQVGAGVATAPIGCFVEALLDLADRT